MVVVASESAATTLNDLAWSKVSASVGSAGHGTLVRVLDRAGIRDVDVLNQQPQVGASALEYGQVQGLSQFVAWPGLLVFQGKAKLLYDGAELDLPDRPVAISCPNRRPAATRLRRRFRRSLACHRTRHP